MGMAGPRILLLCFVALFVSLKFCEPTDYVHLPSKTLTFIFLLIALDVLQGRINEASSWAQHPPSSLDPLCHQREQAVYHVFLVHSPNLTPCFSNWKQTASHLRYPHMGLASEQPQGQDSRHMLR